MSSVFGEINNENAKVVKKILCAGRYEVDWDASGYSSGVYFYKLVTLVPMADDFVDVKKMLLIK